MFVRTYKGGDCVYLAFRLIFKCLRNIRQLEIYINVIIKRLPFLFGLLFSTIFCFTMTYGFYTWQKNNNNNHITPLVCIM